MKEFLIELSPIITSISTLTIALYAILNYRLIRTINKSNHKMLRALIISNVLGPVAKGVGSFSLAIRSKKIYLMRRNIVYLMHFPILTSKPNKYYYV